MRHLDFSIGGKTVSVDVPEHWREMSERQFMAVCKLSGKELDEVTFYSEYFGIPKEWVKSIDIYYFYVLSTLLEVVRQMDAFGDFIIKKIGHFVCPMPNLSGMTFHQFMTVDTFFTWYLQTDNRKFLDRMCAALYLKSGEDFATLDIDERVKEWAPFESDKTALLISWTIIKKWLAKAYPYLFPSGTDEVNKHGSRKISNTWLEIFDTLVQEDLGRIDSYKKLEAMDVIRIVNRRIKEQKNRK